MFIEQLIETRTEDNPPPTIKNKIRCQGQRGNDSKPGTLTLPHQKWSVTRLNLDIPFGDNRQTIKSTHKDCAYLSAQGCAIIAMI